MDITFGIAGVAAISVICFLIGQGIKVSPINSKYIPVICGIAGAILGAVALLIGMPDFPAADIITAVAVGIVSGLAATGVDQAIKQLKRG